MASISVPDRSRSASGFDRFRLGLGRDERQVQVTRQDGVTLGEDDGALDAVLQLADVSRPAIRDQGCSSAAGDSVSGVFFMSRQKRSMKKRASSGMSPGRSRSGGTVIGKTDRRKKRSSRNRRAATAARSPLVRRRDQPHVDLYRRRSADALEAPFLESAEDLGLQRERQVANLVEEERAAMRHLELARLARDGAGEGALFVAEELGFEQRLRESPRS